jgi:hypothetical protein
MSNDIILTPAEIEEIKRINEWPKQEKSNPIYPEYDGFTGILIGTGPSINDEQLKLVESYRKLDKCRVFTINNAYEKAHFSDVHFSGDGSWWQLYYPRVESLRNHKANKYTWYPEVARRFNINYIAGALRKDGLSFDPSIIHINGSGPSSINLALHYGIKKLLLIGHDMKYASDYDGRNRRTGSTPRHYFSEYPEPLQQWPKVGVGDSAPGVLDCLIKIYKRMSHDLEKTGMDVINCTPGSALTVFPMSDLEAEIGCVHHP